MSVKSENRKKLTHFFNKEYQSLKHYVASRVSGTIDAEDVVQDVAYKLFSGADSFASINNVAQFVYRSLRNKTIDLLKKPKRELPQATDSSLSLEQFDSLATEFHLDNEETYLLLKKHILALKPMYRDIIWAVDIQGYSYQELSLELGVPQGTLMSRRHRALSILFTELSKNLNPQV
ncbi:ECF RNA polymerase sigma factor SigE [Tenacibaculum litopenaei]|jgi:RNA polymerase sigma-70 factor (ECF subfamily)|uniref:RNA polymerase sigma factor n=1 Tax=Tenacibaculum litopenaei TaxID=396016 RepID=UPI003893584D